MQGCLKALGVLALMTLAAAAALWFGGRFVLDRAFNPDPTTVASASLKGLQAQNRLTTFSARYVAVVTSSQKQYGLSAQKTLIMPGLVRYEVDLGKLTQRDVIWDAQNKTLKVRLPSVEVVGPQVDFSAIKEYGEGGILMTFTDAEAKMDAANRKAGQVELIRQAREAEPMKLAKDATRRAVERSFAMPLKAAGIDAKVQAIFPDERFDDSDEQWDVSKSLEEVLGNKAAPAR